MNRILARLLTLKRQIIILWHAFWHPATPLYLKVLMLSVVAYVISPIDLLPDFLVGLGIVDDVLLVAIAMNWIVKKLPREIFSKQQKPSPQSKFDEDGSTIDGTSRRL